jgi:ATP-dependent DNA helicase RecG
MENMDKKEFEFLLKQGEGLKLEFKENLDSKNLAKEIVAFANTEGGRIFIGVNDKGEVKGVQITNKLKSEIQDIARGCDPSINIEIETIDNVLIIDVDEGIKKPYRCSSGFFLRQGSNSQKLSTEEIRDFFNKEGKILFDEGINHEFTLQNGFSKKKFDEFLQRAKLSRTISDENILMNLGVLTETMKFKNAGVLFFCDNVEKFFRHAIITCVLYKGKDKYKIIDRKDFTEDVISNYNGAMAFLVRNLRLEYEIKAGPRKEILEIPEDALREAIVNAMAHRDYNEKGANIQIDVYDDRVEISNPGGLVPVIKKEEFGKKSISRNPLLFSLFKSVDLVEKVGSGIERIRKALREVGLPAPIFEFTGFFTVTFKRPPMPTGEKKSVGLVEKLVEGLVESQKKILELIKENPYISKSELSKKVGISTTAVDKNIAKLKEKGLLNRIGPDKGGHWEIK